MPDNLRPQLELCLQMAEALIDAMDAAVPSASADVWRFSSYRQYMRKYNDLVAKAEAIEHIEAPLDTFNLDAVPSPMNSIAMQQQEYFEMVRSNLHILRAYLRNRALPKTERISDIADFLESNLRSAVLSVPEREKEVQDIVEHLLIGRGLNKGMDYDRETGRVKISAKEVIPDFILPPLNTAIEIKLIKDASAVGRIVDEINADIQSYKLAYVALVFVVYDTGGALRNAAEFRRDLESSDGVRVLLIKH